MFGKLKQAFNIGGVKCQLIVDTRIPQDMTQLVGKVIVTTQSDQHVTGLKVKMYEQYYHGTGNERRTEYRTISEINLTEEFDIKPNETREIPFILDFKVWKTGLQGLAQQKGVLGAIGQIGMFLDNEKSNYWVEADVHVKGSLTGSSNKTSINFV